MRLPCCSSDLQKARQDDVVHLQQILIQRIAYIRCFARRWHYRLKTTDMSAAIQLKPLSYVGLWGNSVNLHVTTAAAAAAAATRSRPP